MSDSTNTIETFAKQEYKWGFVSPIDSDSIPRGLSEDVVRLLSTKTQEPEWLLECRLKAYRHWLTMTEPTWANIHYPKIDYQDIIYYAAPKSKTDGPKSLDVSTRNCFGLMKSWVFRWLSERRWPAWRWTRCSIRFPWLPPSR